MPYELPGAVPEIPVNELGPAVAYYEHQLGFALDWGGEEGIVGLSRGSCRLFLADRGFRERRYGNAPPVLVWLNLGSKLEVDDLHKPWKLHEFTVADLDGNLFRVFYDFAWETRGE